MIISRYSELIFPKAKLIDILQEVNDLFQPTLEERILSKANHKSFEGYLNKVLENGIVLIAHNKIEIAGFTMVYANDNINFVSYIPLVAIVPIWQGQGLGSKLMYETLKIAKDSGMKIVKIKTWIGNKNAIKLYMQCGFKKVEVADENVIMEIKL